jgi:hypothetical protein
VLGDAVLDDHDDGRYARAGGVPVTVTHTETGPHLPVLSLVAALGGEGPGSLDESWLTQAGLATRISDGTVQFLVLATGEADRAALNAELDAAAVNVADAVNRARADAQLPPVVAHPQLEQMARGWVRESSKRGCSIGLRPEERGCPDVTLDGIDSFWVDQATWYSATSPFQWTCRRPSPVTRR